MDEITHFKLFDEVDEITGLKSKEVQYDCVFFLSDEAVLIA